jgi:hypothetical protein
MFSQSIKFSLIAAYTVTSLFSLAALTVADSALAGERHRAFNVQGPKGGSAVVDRSVTRNGGGNRTVTDQWQGTNGKTGSRITSRQVNPDTGAITRDTTRTGPNGKTTTSDSTITKNPDGSTSIAGDGLRRNGSSYDMSRTTTTNTDGSKSSSATFTGENGKTRTTQGISQRGDDGSFTRSGTYTTGNGSTGSYSASGVRIDDGFARTQSWTTPSGEAKERSVTTNRMDGGGVSKTVTGPNGESRTWTATPISE